MNRVISVILAAAMFLYVLCGCSSITELVEKIKNGMNANGNEISESVSAGEDSILNIEAEFNADIEVPEINDILHIAQKYYKLARSKATVEELGHIGELIVWQPDFTGNTVDSKNALQFSYPAAFLAAYTDLENVYLALNAAVFAFDIKNPISAGNLASAIAAYPEDVKGKPLALIFTDAAEFTEDADKVYKYALSLTLTGEVISAEALPLLLNYGNFCIDTEMLDTAKQMFEAALNLAPDYYPANEGMAAYWLAAGDKHKAEEILKKAKKPMMYAVMAKSGKNSSEEVAPEVKANENLSAMEAKLEKLAEVPILLATDFYEGIDPEGAAEARRFVDNLATEWKYTAPDYKYLSQYSTLKAFESGQGQAAFKAFKGQFQAFAQGEYAQAAQVMSQNLLGGMGIDLGGIDMADMMKNPEKYKDKGKDINVEGLKDFAEKMAGMAKQAEAGLKEGNVDALIDMVSNTAPELAIYKMKPGDYANPTDILTQKYNMTVLHRKLLGYKNYFFKQVEELKRVLEDDGKKLSSRMDELKKGMEDALAQLAEEHENSHSKSGECGTCVIKRHSIHMQYYPQMNNINETCWMDATNFMNSRYTQKLKGKIEEMYAECMSNCMLISDPDIRKIKEDEIKTEVYGEVIKVFGFVLGAYGLKEPGYPFECSCDPAAVAAAEEQERKRFQEEEANKTLMENKARKEFEAGIIKESSQLYQRLDKYSAGLHLMFMDAKWHPLKTEVKFKVKIPLDKLETGADFGWTTEHIRNTTTYGGGLSASAKGEIGKLEAGGTLSVQGEMTVDGNGNIVRGDVVGTASGTLSGGSHEATGTYEASVMRGCKLSGEVARLTGDTLKPPNGGEAWDDYASTIGVFQPDKPKKILWKGEYKLSE